MNDQTEQALTDELRLAAKSAAPYGTAMIGASHLIDAADTIDNLRAENESLREQRNRIGLCIAHALSGGKKDDHEAGLSGRMDAIRALRAQLAEAQRDAEVSKQINRACMELPDDFRIAIELERNAGCVYLLQEGEDIGFDDPCEGIARSISDAIDAAKGGADGIR